MGEVMETRHRRRGVLARAALAGILAASCLGASATEGSAAPDFALSSTAGANYRLSEYRGEVVALVFCGAPTGASASRCSA
jgi:hypothetical protein